MKTRIDIYNNQTLNLTKLSRPPEYPERFVVEDDQTGWDVELPEYQERPYCITENLSKAMRKQVAEPEIMAYVERSFEGVRLDEAGRPLHPQGRTGIGGRGHLYAWGESLTVDAVVARHSVAGDELLVIRKPGETKPALPGGFLKPSEDVVDAALRETQEETALTIDYSPPRIMGRLITRSKRTTDNVWITTTGVFLPLNDSESLQTPEGGDDAAEAAWLPLSQEMLLLMSDHHRVLVQTVIDLGEISLRGAE